jgi:hypothetical protein
MLFSWVAEETSSFPSFILVSVNHINRIYTLFIVQAYKTSQFVVPRGSIFFLASGAALSQEVSTVK